MFIAVLFIIARNWKQPRCASTEEQIKKINYIFSNNMVGKPLDDIGGNIEEFITLYSSKNDGSENHPYVLDRWGIFKSKSRGSQ